MVPQHKSRLTTVEEDFKKIFGESKEPENVPMSHADAAPGGDPVEHGKKEKKMKKESTEVSEGWKARVKAKLGMATKKHGWEPGEHTEGWKQRVKAKIGMEKKALNMGLDNVSNLLEDVANIVNGITKAERSEMIRGFAQMAIVAETVGTRFGIVAEQDGDFAEAAQHMLDLAEASAQLAEDLHSNLFEGKDFDLSKDEVENCFRNMMSDCVEGLEVYDDLVQIAEDAKDGDPEDDDDDADDQDKKEKKDGDDSEDDQDKEPEADKEEDALNPQKPMSGVPPRGFNQDDRNPNAYGAQKGHYEDQNPR